MTPQHHLLQQLKQKVSYSSFNNNLSYSNSNNNVSNTKSRSSTKSTKTSSTPQHQTSSQLPGTPLTSPSHNLLLTLISTPSSPALSDFGTPSPQKQKQPPHSPALAQHSRKTYPFNPPTNTHTRERSCPAKVGLNTLFEPSNYKQY